MTQPTTQSDVPFPAPSDAQQKVLQRIALQRDRLRARRAAHRQALAVRSGQQPTVEPDAPLVARLLAFARLHPAVVAVAAVAALAVGPSRIIRWSTVLMPLISRMR